MGTVLGTYEIFRVYSDGEIQTVENWVPGTGYAMATPRTQINAVTMTNGNLNTIPVGHDWIYIGAGRTASGTLTPAIEAVKVNYTDGTVALSANGVDSSKTASGYCFFRANNFLYYYAYDTSLQTGLSRQTFSAQTAAEGGSCTNNCFPGVQSFNTDVATLSHPRK